MMIQNRLAITVENLLVGEHAGKSGGTGLANLAARLELLYGKDFTLSTGATGNHYQAYLTIPL